MSRAATLVAALVLSGCASHRSLQKRMEAAAVGLPRTAEVSGVPFIRQTEHYCGPASLAMVLAWSGHPRTLGEIAPQIYTPGKKGSLQNDVLGAGRRQGLLSVPIYGTRALLQEVAAGHPVIVLQNLGFSFYPFWHYAVVIGYDLDRGEVILHSGYDEAKREKLSVFADTWQRAQEWGAVVLPVTELSASADDLQHVAAAAVLEKLERPTEAEAVYQAVLRRWPESLGAHIGLGNTRYKAGDFKSSVRHLRAAVRTNPTSAAAWHNLATAEKAAHSLRRARQSARRALELVPPEEALAYRESLRALL